MSFNFSRLKNIIRLLNFNRSFKLENMREYKVPRKVIIKALNIIDSVYNQPKISSTLRNTIQLEFDYVDSKYLEIEITANEYQILTIYGNKEKETSLNDIQDVLNIIKTYEGRL